MGRNYNVSIVKRLREIGIRTWGIKEKEGRSQSYSRLITQIKVEGIIIESQWTEAIWVRFVR